MYNKWWELALAVLFGMVMPCVILQSAPEILSSTQPQTQPQSQTQTEPTAVPTETGRPQQDAIMVPVLMDTGQVQLMVLKEYLVGVLLGEMPVGFEMEALKAQAVVARTYTLKRMELGDKHMGAAVCTDSTCCQAYVAAQTYEQRGGSAQGVEKVMAAVEATVGEVVKYEGALIEATYFSCSGGRTEDAVAVWGSDIPYLQAVDSPGEENAEAFYACVYFTKAEFAAALGRTLWGTPGQWLGAVTYTDGGGVATATVAGLRYSGTQLRQLLGLNSTRFQMIPGEAGVTIETTGHGHRVGMSQYGADAMAKQGKSYIEILHHYYQSVVIDKIGTIE